MVEPIYSSEESTIFYDFSVKDRIIALSKKDNLYIIYKL